MATEDDLAEEHAPEEINWRPCLRCGALFRSLSRFNRRCRTCRAKDGLVGPMLDLPRLKRLGPKGHRDDAA